MNKVPAKIIGFELSDIRREDSYEWGEFLKKSLIFREFNLAYPNKSPLSSVETHIEWRLFEDPNTFRQHLRFHSKVRFEFAKSQPWLSADDLFNLYVTHAEQTNDIFEQMLQRNQLQTLIKVPTSDKEVRSFAQKIYELHFKDTENA